MESEARKLHGQALTSSERGNYLEALHLIDEATLLYQEDKDYFGLSEAQAMRFSIFKHLFQETGDSSFAILGKYTALGAVEIAKKFGTVEALAIPLFNLGKAYAMLGEFREAMTVYNEAIENLQQHPDNQHHREAVLADMESHLAQAEYHEGDKSALQRAEQALEKLEKSGDANAYEKDVWRSGAHLRIAEMVKKDDPEKSNEHLKKAKEIIERNKELVLRKVQLEKLDPVSS